MALLRQAYQGKVELRKTQQTSPPTGTQLGLHYNSQRNSEQGCAAPLYTLCTPMYTYTLYTLHSTDADGAQHGPEPAHAGAQTRGAGPNQPS